MPGDARQRSKPITRIAGRNSTRITSRGICSAGLTAPFGRFFPEGAGVTRSSNSNGSTRREPPGGDQHFEEREERVVGRGQMAKFLSTTLGLHFAPQKVQIT